MFPNAEFTNQLASIAREVRDAATMDGGRGLGPVQRENGLRDVCLPGLRLRPGRRYYCQAISFIMGELRQQRKRMKEEG